MKKRIKEFFVLFLFITISSSCVKQEVQMLELYKIEKDGLFGFIDSLGNEVIKPQYLFTSEFSEGLALVVVDTAYQNNLLDYSNCSNYLDSLEVRLETPLYYSDTSIVFKYGFINSLNKIVIDTTLTISQYYTKEVSEGLKDKTINLNNLIFHSDRALIQDTASLKYGFMNKEGRVVIKPQYWAAHSFSEGLSAVNLGATKLEKNKWGYIDLNDSIIIAPKYTDAYNFKEGLAIVYLAGSSDLDKKGGFKMSFNFLVINKDGNIQGTPLNSMIYYPHNYSDGYSVVEHRFFHQNLGYRFMNKNGDFTTDFDLIDVTRFGDGYAGVKTEEGWVFIDKQMNIKSGIYEDVSPFNNGFARVKKEKMWGYIDTTFQEVIPCKFDSCWGFKGSLAKVLMKSQALYIYGYINKEGKIVWQDMSHDFSKNTILDE